MGFYLELFSRNVAQCYGAGFLAVGYVIGARDNIYKSEDKVHAVSDNQGHIIMQTPGYAPARSAGGSKGKAPSSCEHVLDVKLWEVIFKGSRHL